MNQMTIAQYCTIYKCKPTINRHLQHLIQTNRADTLLKKWGIAGWQVVGRTLLLGVVREQ